VDDADLNDEMARMEREEEGREAARDAIVAAARSGQLADRLAGIWQDGDELVVAVTSAPHDAERQLRAIAKTPLRVTVAKHLLSELESLCVAIWEEADRLGAPLAATGVDEMENRATAMLERLDLPASQALQERFAGQPVQWEEGTVVAVGRARRQRG